MPKLKSSPRHVNKRSKPRPKKSLYHPVDSTKLEIRLLHIDTHPTDRAGRIECRLEHVSLLDQPPNFYEAISWCWGDPTPRKDIVLDGARFKVSMNAEEVIRHLCFEQGHAIVWLDAVCIDQSNIQERAEQVAIMKDVYPRAERVLVWLGNNMDSSAEAAMESIDKILAQCSESAKTPEDYDSVFFYSDGRGRFTRLELPHCDWAAVETFFSAPLFVRVWFIQEVVLSKQASCFCGRFSRTWNDVILAAQWLNHRSYWQDACIGHLVTGLENLSSIWQFTSGKDFFANWLVMGTEMQTSLPSDKVYGLLGLLQMDENRRLELKPDYNARLDLVYTTATRLAIEELAGHLDQLYLLPFTRYLVPPEGREPDSCDRLSWPSWVLRYDWSLDSTRSPAPVSIFGNGVAEGLPATIREFDPVRPHILSVKGLVVSRCCWRGELLPLALFERDDDLHCFAKALLHCRSVAQAQDHSNENIAVTLTSRCNVAGHDALEDVEFMESYYRCLAACEEMVKADQESQSSINVAAAVADYRQAMSYGTCNRVFFMTASGHMGTAPGGMERDDTVAILFGSVLPMVLREQKDGQWRLIGNAYVHGIMEGEYFRQLKEEGRLEEETQWFDIC
ncbi:hypothetical protein M409DRAFT_24198 [Zasmidium cellare ATCC 36951]|uniref:Heterokaryon incompatibility domain-containing protein n=1 Tax=Zasmidium cellare ATCC 36951 TaxID=1080233 RepID=A0A6A6CI31_ZASCE|nr:uncharacterized protein M409DRAFT_24198 [Zasmidium cellare ATCC 36951]KAF2165349.1 hypothetical protein M409DRAFT_24198 [Zasmidium cellare ATCC 36951]